MKRPEARKDGILSRWVDGELVVVDSERHRAHCLNRPAALLWQGCDGQTCRGMLLARMTDGSSDIQQGEALVEVGLQQLAEARLLKDHSPKDHSPTEAARPGTRRELLRKLGAAALVPLVTSILLPTPAMAQSNLPNGAPCTTSSQCASGCCHAVQMTCKPGAGNCL